MKHIYIFLCLFLLGGVVQADGKSGVKILEELKHQPLTLFDRGSWELNKWWLDQGEYVFKVLRRKKILTDEYSAMETEQNRVHWVDDRIYLSLQVMPDTLIDNRNISKATCHNILEHVEDTILFKKFRDDPYSNFYGTRIWVISQFFTGVNASQEYVLPIEDMLWVKVDILEQLACQSSLYSDEVEYIPSVL